jgi:hypothetical protein
MQFIVAMLGKTKPKRNKAQAKQSVEQGSQTMPQTEVSFLRSLQDDIQSSTALCCKLLQKSLELIYIPCLQTFQVSFIYVVF